MRAGRAESSHEPRRYRVLGVLGQGAHGRVYRARLEAAGGFERDVALKLIRDDVASDSLLSRFRDEARILGLVRDRAIVSVEPPVRLHGRWAIVLEYVEGASAHRLLKAGGGPIPPGVAVEIVQELARVLDKIWRVEGPEGRPLELIHRDLKPSNVQITSHGEVKLLDFGVARATFQARETQTVTTVGGTLGYIAPERVKGREGPASDVYSLGVVLHVLVTNDHPLRLIDGVLGRSKDVAKVLELADRMRADDPDQRPTARQVEEACRQLRVSLGGPSLRDWAETAVPAAIRVFEDDELVGTQLTETVVPGGGGRPVSVPLSLALGGASAVGGLALAVLGASLGVGGLAFALWPRSAQQAELAGSLAPAVAAPVEPAADAEPVEDEPAVEDTGVAAPAKEAPAEAAPRPRATRPREVATAPTEPAADPAPRGGACVGPEGALLGYANAKLFTLGKGAIWVPQGERPVYRDYPREENGFVAPSGVVCTLAANDRVRIEAAVVRVPKQGAWIPIMGGSVRRP